MAIAQHLVLLAFAYKITKSRYFMCVLISMNRRFLKHIGSVLRHTITKLRQDKTEQDRVFLAST